MNVLDIDIEIDMVANTRPRAVSSSPLYRSQHGRNYMHTIALHDLSSNIDQLFPSFSRARCRNQAGFKFEIIAIASSRAIARSRLIRYAYFNL
jgi:hypothetical protein